MRRCSVSMPCSSMNAENGESVGPSVRMVSMRAFMVNPKSPNDSWKITPWYPRDGVVICGNLPLPQSNLPDSTTTPPMVVPWPPRYLVTEWMTMSAPCSIGRQRYGDASVLSMTSGTPASCAIAATAAMSSTLSCGLPSVSAYSALVLGLIARRKFSGSAESTNVVSMPNWANVTANCEYVPP